MRTKVILDHMPDTPESCPFARICEDPSFPPNCLLKCNNPWQRIDTFSCNSNESCDMGSKSKGYPGVCQQCASKEVANAE